MAQHNKEVMTAFYQSQQRKYVLNEIVKCFDAAKILNIPLKGSVICDYYPEPWMRSSCDVDILIKNEDSERAIACLSKLGYTYKRRFLDKGNGLQEQSDRMEIFRRQTCYH